MTRSRLALPLALTVLSCTRAPASTASPTPASSDRSAPVAASLTDLKEAARDCRIVAFRPYMTASTAASFTKQDEDIRSIQRSLDDLFALSQQRFGGRVHREPHGLKFEIDGSDPRWVEILGPGWSSEKVLPGPKYFTLSADLFWKEECDVVRAFEACLEDPRSCARTDVPGSALQVRRENDQWRLEEVQSAEQERMWAHAVAFIQSSLKTCAEELVHAPATSADEDLLVSLASKYVAQVKALASAQ